MNISPIHAHPTLGHYVIEYIFHVESNKSPIPNFNGCVVIPLLNLSMMGQLYLSHPSLGDNDRAARVLFVEHPRVLKS